MAGVLNFRPSPVFRPAISSPRRTNRRVGFRVRAEIQEASSSKFSAPPDFKAPVPKRFFVRSDKAFDVFTAALGLFFRFGSGVFVAGYSATVVSDKDIAPGEYALEVGDSTILQVREIVAILDLDVLFYPCPRNGPNFRSKVAQLGGKQQFPYMLLMDSDSGTAISLCLPEFSSKTLTSLAYISLGDGSVPLPLSLGLLTGTSYVPSKLPPQPLEIWAYEVPYLEDPNTGVKMFESAEIIEYLRVTYALA
ncbi:hypothetical protein Sjap_012397 [Stephania japonica]|uniref:Uncharacterized protein n=1 Tax=Stephania japonica TaxID=461633 RepID=A0AAP0IWP0_9MAGN